QCKFAELPLFNERSAPSRLKRFLQKTKRTPNSSEASDVTIRLSHRLNED
ncbi:hypothetical protein BIW11_06779, partial [Tropilaelaps mercedesae]